MESRIPTSGRRPRGTTARVRWAERISSALITVGGIGTIVAVTLIFFFLVWVVLPLFSEGAIEPRAEELLAAEADTGADAPPARILLDEYQVLGVTFRPDGSWRVVRLADGSSVDAGNPFESVPTSHAFSVDGNTAAFGFADGSLAFVRHRFQVAFPTGAEIPEELRDLGPDETAVFGRGILQRTPEGKFRHQRFVPASPVPVKAQGSSPVLLLDFVTSAGRQVLCSLDEAGDLRYYELSERENLLTGEVSFSARAHALEYEAPEGMGRPAHLLLHGLGDNVFLVWEDGYALRIDSRDPDAAQVAEILDLVPEDGRTLTAVSHLLGKSTLLVGDSAGVTRGWFATKPADAGTLDGIHFVDAHAIDPEGEAAVTALRSSPRSRLLSIGYADGSIRLYHPTSGVEVAGARLAEAPITALAIAPKEDGVAALAGRRMGLWMLDPKHPEASFGSLFGTVWYEGYEGPQHVWQSSSGTDDFEEKLGLVPLVFGTLKATFYSMLFGAPLALLAAIFTSEFLDRRVRAPLKSSIEMMASLPSVVLGFLAAIIIAPFVQSVLPATLAMLLIWPFTLLAGAYLWQLLPRSRALKLGSAPRLLCIGLTLPIAVALASWVGPLVERLFFDGNLELWLDGQSDETVGGWFLLLLPLSGAAVAFGSMRWVNPRLRRAAGERYGRADLLKFAASAAVASALSLGAAVLLDAAGFDPRGGFVDTYVQRNALVVGFVMGFAVIPIIYTLAEDALSSVPEHLRLASLACGATPWQTAIRIIVPTAMSGLFSALMIGLGRAVGETMIVLMATGNTPVMDFNVFSGFRTLSANIAVELPEAVQNSTHYRTLFLAALVLFAMTFAVNTIAEMVRQRFRRRAYQL